MNTSKKVSTALVILILPILQACSAGAAWEGTVTDSAGIAVVHNPDVTLWRAGEEWTVTEDLRIGTVAGDPEYQFGQLTFLDVGPDGTIYAMDFQASEVKVYDAQGTYVRTIGGPGQGPGEIGPNNAFVLVSPEKEVIVPDLTNGRVNFYTDDGEPKGSFPISIEAGAPALWAVDGSGRLMAQLRGLNVPGIAALQEGDPIVVYDTAGVVVDTVAVLPKGQTLAGTSEEQFSIMVFAAEPIWDIATDGTVFYAMSDQYRILVNDPQGDLVRIITRPYTPKPVEEQAEEAIRRLMRQQFTDLGLPPAQAEQFMSGVGFADYYPAFGQFFLGPDGSLWVQRVRSARDMADGAGEEFEFDPQDIGSPEWEVMDSEGRYLGVVTFPDRFRPVTAHGDRIYGIWADELDVQYVMRLRVERPAQ